MLAGTAPQEGLNLLLEALKYEPANPLLLTNIANLYIKLDKFGEAERYAKQALSSMPDFGPAYQVLTTCHLKNGNSILASETMVKSAKHMFNDLTIYHFENFLDAVEEQLDPKDDEYPLKEEFLKELYYIAKENVDVLDVSKKTDTPEAQLTIPDIPNLPNSEDLRLYKDYLRGFENEAWNHYLEMETQYSKYKRLVDQDEDQDQDKVGLVYHIEKNIRQKYAFEVLRSFYVFKLEKAKLNMEEQLEAIAEDEQQECYNINKKHDELVVQAGQLAEKTMEQGMNAIDAGQYETANALIEKAVGLRDIASIDIAKIRVQEEKEILKNKLYMTQKRMDIINSQYKKNKQTLEEYWLRSGGILKYIADENVFYMLDSCLRMDVDEYMSDIFDKLAFCSSGVYLQYVEVEGAEKNLSDTEYIINAIKADKEQKEEAQRKANSLKVGMEDAVISVFPEKNAVGDLGFEFDLFDIISASGSTNGDDYSLELSGSIGMLKGTVGGRTITENNQVSKEAYTTVSVEAKLAAEDLVPYKVAGVTGKILGKLSFSKSESAGRYNVMSIDNKIMEFGTIDTSESKFEAVIFGVSDQKTIRRSSLMSGVAVVDKSKKYKFVFMTYTVPAN